MQKQGHRQVRGLHEVPPMREPWEEEVMVKEGCFRAITEHSYAAIEAERYTHLCHSHKDRSACSLEHRASEAARARELVIYRRCGE